jgi:hypothetical protein
MKRLATTALALILFTPAASAAVIEMGDHILKPDTPNQEILIRVTGDALITVADLFITVHDGGGPNGQNITAPEITGIEMIQGTIFESNHDPNWMWEEAWPLAKTPSMQTASPDSPVVADGVLARVYINTENWTAPQTWTLSGSAPPPHAGTSDLLHGDTPLQVQVNDGSIRIAVPEPATLGLLGLGALLLAGRRR